MKVLATLIENVIEGLSKGINFCNILWLYESIYFDMKITLLELDYYFIGGNIEFAFFLFQREDAFCCK